LPAFASRAAFANEQTDLDAQIAAEKREDDVAKATGKATPMHPWHPYAASWSPGGLYNGMIAPFIPMTIRGFIWYQGESNASHNRAVVYSSLLSGLIGDWRARFNQGDLPFLFVQISSFQSPGDDWGLVRDQQRRTLAVANTAMIVTVDIGDANNVHPGDKQTVGSRLALAARSLAYGEPVPYRGPSFREATTERQPNGTVDMRVWFDDATGLNSMGKPITDFEVAGADHRFVLAEAHILDDSILVHSAALDSPRYVRFGWTSVVTNSLYNLTGLPASTFSSEQNPVH
jgi:sialate O-acetylesterase